ncbi:MAG: adenylate/guanylate cyclase domain-containing protein [Armatimonadetes bacterium]|nr:adenylate/guanylate cyclase domain-containing protein [Armatimonadota bacterium]MDW8026910.1 adenylate/guanylate cyclase domain-containing protein [Armatimonadota bacterium]
MSLWQRSVIGALVFLAIAQILGIQDGLNRWLTDAHWRWHGKLKPIQFPNEIVVIAIDDKSVQKLGRLKYWSRARYAQLLERLHQAKVVGLDIIFAEPDELDPEGDKKLAQSLRKHGKVAIPFFEWRTGEERPFSAEIQKQVNALLSKMPKHSHAPSNLPLSNPLMLQTPISELVSSASSLGFANVNADPDGVYRTPVLLKATGDGHLLPHFAIAIACIAQGISLSEALKGAPNTIDLKGRIIRLYNSALPLQPIARRGGSFAQFVADAVGQPVPTFSFVDAISMSPEKFAGKIVLIGETATGTTDIRPTPIDNGLRGVEFLAEILANLLYLPPVKPLPLILQWLLIAFAVLAPIGLYSNFPSRKANILILMVLLLLVAFLETCFWLRFIPSWSSVLLGFLSATALTWFQKFLQEEAEKRRIRETFSLYVPPQVAEEVAHNPDIAHLDGKRLRIAVLFSDIRGFTTYSEQNQPELVVKQMREYLTEMTAAVHEHQGVLDKFIGDAVMALYGPFLPEGAKVNISALAIKSAIDMLERLEKLNEHWKQQGLPTFRIGIGIHVGEAMVGNIGSDRRVQYTALGDTVNLASRLQTLTKDLKATIIVSEDVAKESAVELDQIVEFVDKGTISIRGREQPVRVYEVKVKNSLEVMAHVRSDKSFQTEE